MKPTTYGNITLTVLLLLALSACQGISVESPIDSTFEPSQNGIYAWQNDLPQKSTGNRDTLFAVSLVVREELNAQLTAKGYQQGARAAADFLVSFNYFTVADYGTDQSSEKTLSESDKWLVSVNFSDSPQTSQPGFTPQQANLQVNLTDQGGNVLWQSTAKKAIENSYASQAQYRKVVKQAVAAMLKNLPNKRP